MRKACETVYRAFALDFLVDRYRNPVELVIELLEVIQIAVAVKKYEVLIAANTVLTVYAA